MDAKGLLESKTFWLNVVIVALVAFQALDGVAWIDPKAQAAIVAVLNVIMRLLTNQPVQIGGSK